MTTIPASFPYSTPRTIRPRARRVGLWGQLTRRGRIVAIALVLAAVLALGGVAVARVSAAPAPVARQSIVVQPGDTLWSIAGRLAPGKDPRPLISDIRRLNGLTHSTSIVAGDTLLCP